MASPSGAATVALTCVPAFMVGLDNLVVVTALAPIRDDLQASVEQLSPQTGTHSASTNVSKWSSSASTWLDRSQPPCLKGEEA
jgi:hypothetical protein